MDGSALLLNEIFQPIQLIPWQKAMQLFYLGKAEVLEESNQVIRTVTLSIRMPLVLRLTRIVPNRARLNLVRFTRNNIFLRDRYECQYCGTKPSRHNLTLDHVKPVVSGGLKTWHNIVTACRPCNQRKGGRTPQEAKMTLNRKPSRPHWLPLQEAAINIAHLPENLRILLKGYLMIE
jgi:5-methylcytosine-specific restriction endonuclease McrA